MVTTHDDAGLRKGAFSSLTSLGQEKMNMIDNMLLKDTSVAKVAKVVQEDWGDLLDHKPASVQKLIQRYRAKCIDGKLIKAAERAAKTKSPITKAVATVLTSKIDALADLESLVEIQKGRLTGILQKETQLNGMLMSSIRYEIKEMRDLLMSVANLQLETGILRRAPKQLQGLISVGSPGHQEMVAFEASVGDRDALLGAVMAAMEQLGEDEPQTDADVAGVA